MSEPVVIDWNSIPIEYPYTGIERQTVHGRNQTIVRYVYHPGSVYPVHQHPQEQITMVLSGSIDFSVDGRPITLGAGRCAIIPPNIPHGARVIGSEVVVTLNTMSPRRSTAPEMGSTNEEPL